MAKAMIACFRRPHAFDPLRFVALVESRLTPDNARVRPTCLCTANGVITCVYNPPINPLIRGPNVALGAPFDSPDLFTPGAATPDGTFALFRSDAARVEILSDYTASRSIWYCCTDDVMVAATSQRMMVLLLGSFMPDDRACRWMLTAGNLGAADAWDQRFCLLPPNSRLTLTRATWSLTRDDGSAVLAAHPIRRSRAEHKAALRQAVAEAVDGSRLEGAPWTLALSGGVDSRSMLYHLKGRPDLELVTWGLAEARLRNDSDAAIAQQLATLCGLPHSYVETDIRTECLPATINRFLTAGEGRIDHLPGYMDGLAFWASLSASGRNIVRGYDASGPKPPVLTEFQARRTAELWLTADYRSPGIPGDWVCSTDDLPDWLKRGRGESLADWRDRLWLQFRTPRVTAALDDIKLAYAEVANPLLSRNVVTAILDLPHELRAGKTLFREIVREMFPSVPFAGRVAIQHSRDVVLQPGFDRLFHDELDRCDAKTPLSAALLRLLGESVVSRTAGQSLRWRARKALKRWLPPVAAVWRYRLMTHDTVDPRQIAVRALLALRTTRLFEEDAALGHAAAIGARESLPATAAHPVGQG
jgi:hypothetical protein